MVRYSSFYPPSIITFGKPLFSGLLKYMQFVLLLSIYRGTKFFPYFIVTARVTNENTIRQGAIVEDKIVPFLKGVGALCK